MIKPKIVLSEKELNNIKILEHYFKYEWWKSSKTGRRCLFPPNTIPRDFTGSTFQEWFLERAEGKEDLVGGFNVNDYPDFYSDFAKAFELLLLIRDKYKSGFTICDYAYNQIKFDLNLTDLNLEIVGVASIPEAIALAALKLINYESTN